MNTAFVNMSRSPKLIDLELSREFLGIINNKSLKIVFQPILDLKSGKIFGYESLTRGPKQSKFHSPIELFSFAEKYGALYTLEKITRELAIQQSNSMIKSGEKLFININSQVIYDPNFTPGHTISLLENYQISPADVVFEITERSAIQDFSAFCEVLNHYRDQGFKVAVDDAGAGYSSLQAISEIKPDFIKIDRSLISGVAENEVKMHILEAFVTFAQKMNSSIIAEGIETAQELHKVIELGINHGQGYYLAQPDYPPQQIPYLLTQEILQSKTYPQ